MPGPERFSLPFPPQTYMAFVADPVPEAEAASSQQLFLGGLYEPERLHSAGVALGTLNNAVYRSLANR